MKQTTLALIVVGVLRAAAADAQTCAAPYPTLCPTYPGDTNSVMHYAKTQCSWCHGTYSNPSSDDGYFNTAFNMVYNEQWIWSSYWAPGNSKAYSAWRRASEGSMPPGVNGGNASQPLINVLYCYAFFSLANPDNYWGPQVYDGSDTGNFGRNKWRCQY